MHSCRLRFHISPCGASASIAAPSPGSSRSAICCGGELTHLVQTLQCMLGRAFRFLCIPPRHNWQLLLHTCAMQEGEGWEVFLRSGPGLQYCVPTTIARAARERLLSAQLLASGRYRSLGERGGGGGRTSEFVWWRGAATSPAQAGRRGRRAR